MTESEMSIEFDLLYNNIASNQAPGLTEYEKSVFLTQAKEAIIKSLYNGGAGNSFESSEEVTRYLNSLVVEKELPITTTTKEVDLSTSNVWYVVYRAVTNANNSKSKLVVPCTNDEIYKALENPFRKPSDRKILCTSKNETDTLYGDLTGFTKYVIRYIKEPSPIILENLNGLKINNSSVKGGLNDVPTSLHRYILTQAVTLAKAAWSS